MEFYFRTESQQQLEILRKQSETSGKMTVLLGRRRVGKTSLSLEFAKDSNFVYLFVAKKSEVMLCEGFVEEIIHKLNIQIHGKIETFKEIFTVLLNYAKSTPLTLIIDEFQEFYKINPAVYSETQGLWDINKNDSCINIIFIGSAYSLMHKIFENEKEPLFGRADRIICLRPFTIPQMQHILHDYGINGLEKLFEFYVITGCVPKYLDIFLTNQCNDLDSMLDFMLCENSPFLNEGRNVLIEEFGKDYTTYFSILELIARGRTSSSEIQSMIHKNVSAYLNKLENDYNVIQKIRPIDAKPNSKLVKYQIIDNFLRFWFKFFHRNRDAIEIHNYDYIKAIIKRDFNTYSGLLLEKLFFELLAETKKFNRMGSYWERGYKDEIDIVAINDLDKTIIAAEVKRSKRRNSQARLEHRAAKLLKHYPNYDIEYMRLNLSDAEKYLSVYQKE